MQFDGEKPDKITRGACACNDDKVIFENLLNWTTRSFILAKQGVLWIPQIPSVTNAIEISDMRNGTGGWVRKATAKEQCDV